MPSSFTLIETLPSKLDNSVNFLFKNLMGKTIEARFVQRDESKIIIYLSSQTGCEQACRFCHLTQMGLNKEVASIGLSQFYLQTRTIFDYLSKHDIIKGSPTRVSFNFMARGEPLLNTAIRTSSDRLFSNLTQIAQSYHYPDIDFKISSILPYSQEYDDTCRVVQYRKMLDRVVFESEYDVELYFSLYSTRNAFHKHWVPNGLFASVAGEVLSGVDYRLVLHHALIDGENDSEEDAHRITNWMQTFNITARFNLVRYNPYSSRCGRESSLKTIQAYMQVMKDNPRITHLQMVSRVGQDIAASCGMFLNQ